MYRLSDWADEYERITRKQNRGGVCDHCGSALGHYGTCSLVNSGEPLVLDSIEQRPWWERATPFDSWWESDGKFYDPDTSDVSWFDKRKELAEYAFRHGWQGALDE